MEKQGKYIATDQAINLHKSDPQLSRLAFGLVSNAKKIQQITPGAFELDWETLKKWRMAHTILSAQNAIVNADVKIVEVMPLFILIYLIQSGQVFEQIDRGELEMDDEQFFALYGSLQDMSEGLKEAEVKATVAE